MLSKQVPAGGDEWKGVALPAGAQVGACFWGLMRDNEFWGEDADEFRPERWLGTTAERRKEMEGMMGLVFGYGKWQCLGKEVAMIELNKVFVEVSPLPRREAIYIHIYIYGFVKWFDISLLLSSFS